VVRVQFSWRFVIICQPVNSCSVCARRADAATSIQHLKRIVTGAQRPGLQLKNLADRDMPGQGGTYHYLAYLMEREGRATGMYSSILASTSNDAEVQVRMKLQPAKSE
jgi:hypothetical protein